MGALISTMHTNEDVIEGLVISSKVYDFQVKLICSSTPSFTTIGNSIIFKSTDGCSYINYAGQWIDFEPVYISVFFLMIGLLMWLDGGRNWAGMAAFFGFVGGFVATLVNLGGPLIDAYPDASYMIWVVLAISIVVGFIAALFFSIFESISFFGFGFVAGYILINFLLIVCGFYPEGVLHIAFDVITGIIMGIVCVKLERKFTIIIGSLVGAATVVFFGGSMYGILPTFPEIMDHIENGEEGVKVHFFIALGVTILLWIIGIALQLKLYTKDLRLAAKAKEEEEAALEFQDAII